MPSKTETQDRSFCLRRDWCRDTDLICTNGKRDSGAKLTSPEFLRTICLNRGPTGLPMQMVNNSNQCECVPLASAPLLFARQNVILFNKGETNLLYNRTK